jgi:hypothetical protein
MADVCISTVGDRRALHFVYYSAMKKTVYRLTKCVFGAPAARAIFVNVTVMRRDATRNERAAH